MAAAFSRACLILTLLVQPVHGHYMLASGGPVARYNLTHSNWVANRQLLGGCWQAWAGWLQLT